MLKRIAKIMAKKYNENELKWILMLKRLDNDGLILVEKSNLNFCPRCGKTLSSTDKEYSSDGYCIHCDFASTLNINKLYS